MTAPFVPPPTRDRLIWAAVDFDGTLAEATWPDPTPGPPIKWNVSKLNKLREAGYKIVIHTARASEAYEVIEAWLNHYGIPFDRIVTGKVLAAIYIDDRGRHADEESWVPNE